MFRLLAGVLLLLSVQVSNAVGNDKSDDSATIDKNLDFKVFLNDREVGSHSFVLQQRGENLLVSSTMSLDFTVLMIKKIKYRHQANEVWRAGCLVSLSSQTQKQGKNISVNAITDNTGLVVEHAEGSETIKGCARGFAYWDPTLLDADYLLNAESGQYLPVEISSTVSSQDNITHMLIAGSKADVRLQYDAAGNWLSLESKLQIGGLLRYQRVATNQQFTGE
jgi:hypothetical protein